MSCCPHEAFALQLVRRIVDEVLSGLLTFSALVSIMSPKGDLSIVPLIINSTSTRWFWGATWTYTWLVSKHGRNLA